MAKVILFPDQTDRRVPSRYTVISRAGSVRGIHVEVWRQRDSSRVDVMLSPTTDGFTSVAHANTETIDLAVMLSQTILSTLQAAEAIWLPPFTHFN